MKKEGLGIFILMLVLLGITSCTKDADEDNGKLYIVTTTGMIGDAVANIVKDKAEVEALMGPGVDPHLYKASQGDLSKLREADIIFYNGLHLEGKMGEILEKFGRQKKVLPVSDGLNKGKLLSAPGFSDVYDPHIWFDVALWTQVVEYISQQLQEFDAENSEYYRENAAEYLQALHDLHNWVGMEVSSIPQQQRVLITAHDAFQYFGKAYNIEVKGLQGISTLSEYGLQDITSMVDFISNNKIKAVFVESSVPEKSLKAVVEGVEERGHSVRIGGTLYSDAMGAEGTPEGTYIGMVTANVNTIVSSLK